jgi:hypothetical protein
MQSRRVRIVFVVLLAGIGISTAVLFANRHVAAGIIGLAGIVGLFAWAARAGEKLRARDATDLSVGAPRAASSPPDGHIRFTLVVDGLAPERIAEVWANLCRPDRVPTEEFRKLFQNFTVTEGRRFRFRSGDPNATAQLLTNVLAAASGVPVRTALEPAAERTPLWS